MFFQWYIFLGTRSLVRSQAILSQLVFEHSLRIRLKAEASGTNDDKSTITEDQSVERSPEASTSSTVVVHAASATEETIAEADTDKSKDLVKGASPPAGEKKKDNLIGKINTLITVDIDNVANGKDFLMIALQVPFEMLLATIFLYVVLGWR